MGMVAHRFVFVGLTFPGRWDSSQLQLRARWADPEQCHPEGSWHPEDTPQPLQGPGKGMAEPRLMGANRSGQFL